MACGPDDVDQLVCAINALKPEWWEQWLPVAAIFLSVAAPFAVAWWVARRSRAHTIEAVTKQIEANRGDVEFQIEQAARSTIAAVERQISANRAEYERERLRSKIEEFVAASAAQAVVGGGDEIREGFRTVTIASTGLHLAVPEELDEPTWEWLGSCVKWLILCRRFEARFPDRESPLNAWIAHSQTLGRMLMLDQPSDLVAEVLRGFAEDMRTRLEPMEQEESRAT